VSPYIFNLFNIVSVIFICLLSAIANLLQFLITVSYKTYLHNVSEKEIFA